jgi:thiamine-monophosphate kinase
VAASALEMDRVSDAGERALIARITGRLAMPAWVVVGPGDDAAVIEPERGTLDVVTTDALIEDVHFDRDFTPPNAIGFRALAVNLSDLAAMGAQPRAAVLSLVLPDGLPLSELDEVLDGLLGLANTYKVAVVGGNIARSPGPLMLNMTLLGSVGRRRILSRTGARPGDEVYVTGTLGAAAVGLAMLRDHADATGEAVERYLRPEPRVRIGMLLGRTRAASACLDLSDGLSTGLQQLAESSGFGIAVDTTTVPVPQEVIRWHKERGTQKATIALADSDDYELLFTVRPANRGRLRAVQRNCQGIPLTRIGVVTKDRKLSLRGGAEENALPKGFEHFR